MVKIFPNDYCYNWLFYKLEFLALLFYIIHNQLNNRSFCTSIIQLNNVTTQSSDVFTSLDWITLLHRIVTLFNCIIISCFYGTYPTENLTQPKFFYIMIMNYFNKDLLNETKLNFSRFFARDPSTKTSFYFQID